MKKRLRRKKHVGECVGGGVPIAVRRRHYADFDDFLEEFITQAIEAHGLAFGGGGQDVIAVVQPIQLRPTGGAWVLAPEAFGERGVKVVNGTALAHRHERVRHGARVSVSEGPPDIMGRHRRGDRHGLVAIESIQARLSRVEGRNACQEPC